MSDTLKRFLSLLTAQPALFAAADAAANDDRAVLGPIARYVPQMIWISHGVGRLDYCNRHWVDYTGVYVGDRGVDAWKDVVHPDDQERCLSQWRDAANRNQEYIAENKLRRADGTYRWHLERATPLLDPTHNVLWWIGSSTDIHVQKRAQQYNRDVVVALRRALVAASLPAIDNVVLDAYYEPGGVEKQVCGDWYSVVKLGDGRCAIIVGDIKGHGFDSVLKMPRVRELFFAALERPVSPASVLQYVNYRLASERTTVSACLGFIDSTATKFTYSLAGHPAPIIVNQNGSAGIYARGGGPLGIHHDAHVEAHEVDLRPGSMLVLYTDGLTKFNNDPVGNEQQLLKACERLWRNSSPNVAEHVCHAIMGAHRPNDDVAVLTVRITNQSSADLN